MTIQIPSGQQNTRSPLWWVIALALVVGGIGLLLALRPWEETALAVVTPTPVPGWEAYRGTPATAGALTDVGRVRPTPIPQLVVVATPSVAVLPAIATCPQCPVDPAYTAAFAAWQRDYAAWQQDYAAWQQAWSAGSRAGGTGEAWMAASNSGGMGQVWPPASGPQMGPAQRPMPGPSCGRPRGGPGQPWAYTR